MIIPSYHYLILVDGTPMEDQLILVNEKDEMVGIGAKLKIHREGLLHRAFSIFIFNSRGELLLQRRAFSKYHSPGLWSNTCCGHPRPGEQTLVAAQRRLKYEMGLDCPLEEVGSFLYRADVGDGLIEHEFDYLLIGHSEADPILNREEAIDSRLASLAALGTEMDTCPKQFTCWLKMIVGSRLVDFRQSGRTLE
jgi:isopentenyl-diphosphate Delta-isomerase